MSRQVPTSDTQLLDLLRIAGPLSVPELADAMEVTATAVRQRFPRLLGQNAIQREATRHGRGRPKYRYRLTEKGLRLTDSNFTDVALTLWKEIRQSSDPELRRETLRRIAWVLASGDAGQIQGKTPAQRMKSLAKLLNQQQIAASEPATLKALVKPSRGITPERLKAVSQMIKAIGGFGRLREILVVIRDVGGVTKLEDWLDTMEMDEPDDGKS
jgi:predicted ArsR family transcriptional regulator